MSQIHKLFLKKHPEPKPEPVTESLYSSIINFTDLNSTTCKLNLRVSVSIDVDSNRELKKIIIANYYLQVAFLLVAF